jgi:hypothetical protein
LDRNQLDLEVDIAAASAVSAIAGAEWGVISIVIRRTDVSNEPKDRAIEP